MWKFLFGGTAETVEAGSLDRERLPRHVAIIMDGNGRWAKAKGLLRTAGHSAGVKTLKKILRVSSDLGIEALTVYAFSTENWKRPHSEVDFLLTLFSDYLAKELAEMNENQVRIHFLGAKEGLPSGLQRQMQEAEELMRQNAGIRFNVAANYGGQDELLRASRRLAERVAAGELAVQDIDAAAFEQALDTAGSPPVDLVIRTSGDMRLSNFLPWQTAYAEFWFTKTNWPDFTPEMFIEALKDFAGRERRFGGLKR